MNLKTILKSSLMLILAGTIGTACGNGNQNNSTENSKQEEVSQSNSLFSQYLAIKNALVETDFDATKKLAEKWLEDERLKNETYKGLAEPLKAISSAKDISEQRKHFEVLSNKLYKLAQNNELSENTIYRQFCPMASGGEGAYWLSDEEKIMNPYFGDKMLHCGMVKEKI